MNNTPSNIFLILLLFLRYYHNCQSVVAATGMKWLTLPRSKQSRITGAWYVHDYIRLEML